MTLRSSEHFGSFAKDPFCVGWERKRKQPKTKAADEKSGKREKFRKFFKKKFENVKSFDYGSEPRNRSRDGQTVREQGRPGLRAL